MGKLLAEGAIIEEKAGAFDSTALHAAVVFGNNPLVVRLLLVNGADVAARDKHAATPLHHAASDDSRAEAGLLLDNNADVRARDSAGNTPLHDAARFGSTRVARLLLAKGADVSAKNCDGKTPRELATMITSLTRLQIAAMIEAEEMSRAKWLAFAMGLQERLGAASCVNVLDEGVARLVLEHV